MAFGTHTKTAEPLEMPFGMMTRVGHQYHVLDGGPDPQGEPPIFEETAAHCKIMGHSMVSCAKMAAPIEMPFWMKIQEP